MNAVACSPHIVAAAITATLSPRHTPSDRGSTHFARISLFVSGEGFDEAAREAGLEAEVYEASDVAMSDGSVMRKGVLFLLTSSSDKDTERTAALKRGLVGTWGWVAENRAGAEAAAEGEGGFGYAYTHEWAAKTAGGRDPDIPPRAVR